MKSINTEILLRNRRLFIASRNEMFTRARLLVDRILVLFPKETLGAADGRELERHISELVRTLFEARYYARMSIGGNNAAPPVEIDNLERAFVDHIETMYSYARSISRFLRHELLIESFIQEHPDVSEEFRGYLAEIRKSDFNLLHVNLQGMRNRLNVYDRFMNPSKAAAAEARV